MALTSSSHSTDDASFSAKPGWYCLKSKPKDEQLKREFETEEPRILTAAIEPGDEITFAEGAFKGLKAR